MLKTIAPDAALRVVAPSADGLHQRDNVEALPLSQVHFQPPRGLALLQVPARSEVAIVCLIRSHGIGIGAGMDGLVRRQVPRCDPNVLPEFSHRAAILPPLSDPFPPPHNL